MTPVRPARERPDSDSLKMLTSARDRIVFGDSRRKTQAQASGLFDVFGPEQPPEAQHIRQCSSL